MTSSTDGYSLGSARAVVSTPSLVDVGGSTMFYGRVTELRLLEQLILNLLLLVSYAVPNLLEHLILHHLLFNLLLWVRVSVL